MILLTANRNYALSGHTIHLLSQGEVDMSATSAEFGAVPASNTVSDAEVEELLDSKTEVELFVVDKHKARAGGAFSKYLNSTVFNLEHMVYFKTLIETTIHTTVRI